MESETYLNKIQTAIPTHPLRSAVVDWTIPIQFQPHEKHTPQAYYISFLWENTAQSRAVWCHLTARCSYSPIILRAKASLVLHFNTIPLTPQLSISLLLLLSVSLHWSANTLKSCLSSSIIFLFLMDDIF